MEMEELSHSVQQEPVLEPEVPDELADGPLNEVGKVMKDENFDLAPEDAGDGIHQHGEGWNWNESGDKEGEDEEDEEDVEDQEDEGEDEWRLDEFQQCRTTYLTPIPNPGLAQMHGWQQLMRYYNPP
jgi:hypothetical protein